VVLVEFKDRLARFGFAYITEALAAHAVRVEVLDGPVVTSPASMNQLGQGGEAE